MKITQELMDELTAKAKASPRLRMNYDLRNSDTDQSQRMLNAIEPGSPLPIHRHMKSSETVVCLRGRLVEEYYRGGEEVQGVQEVQGGEEVQGVQGVQEGKGVQGVQEVQGVEKVQEIELSPNGPVVALNIPIGQWHTVRALESGTVILETKDGAYEPLSDSDVLKL